MHTTHLMLTCLLALGATSTVCAQLQLAPGTGCFDKSNGANGPAIIGVGGINGEPIVPIGGADLTWGMQVHCGLGPNRAALYFWSDCGTPGAPPTFAWPTANPCFGAWEQPPATCGGVIVPTALHLLSGNDADGAGNVTLPFPLVDLRPAVDVVELSQAGQGWCLQFICLDLGSSTPCTAISQGVRFILTYG